MDPTNNSISTAGQEWPWEFALHWSLLGEDNTNSSRWIEALCPVVTRISLQVYLPASSEPSSSQTSNGNSSLYQMLWPGRMTHGQMAACNWVQSLDGSSWCKVNAWISSSKLVLTHAVQAVSHWSSVPAVNRGAIQHTAPSTSLHHDIYRPYPHLSTMGSVVSSSCALNYSYVVT